MAACTSYGPCHDVGRSGVNEYAHCRMPNADLQYWARVNLSPYIIPGARLAYHASVRVYHKKHDRANQHERDSD
jgi:hypothetical protein